MIAIAIDGPAGAGKSTISKLTAQRLNLIYVDTGAMFRAVAYYFILNNIDYEKEENLNKYIDFINIELRYFGSMQRICLNGKDVTMDLRNEEISNATPSVAKNQKIRKKLLDIQRDIASKNNVVMDGRDIGTCVLPDAKLKIFLVASAEERANRRFRQLIRRGKVVDYFEILDNIKKRDEQDMTREIAPLKAAEDAMTVESTHMTVEQVVKFIVTLAKAKFELN
ncbi:MAG TPA: (d)CMP kinase [Clostridiales bacterium]|nr:(d)CMP kinase [Clostridiales bacterium]